MADRFLKHIPSGVVYIYAPPFCNRPEFEECADAAGTPLPAQTETPVYDKPESDGKPKRSRKKAPTPEEQAAETAEAALSEDAARGL